MPELTESGPAAPAPVHASTGVARGYLADVAVIAVWCAAAGLVGALVWWQVTPLAAFTRTKDNAVMAPTEFGKQVATDGWFFVIAAVGGLLSGVALTVWRRRDPLVLVVLLALGGALAAWVMLVVGLHLGPADPREVIRGLKVGARAPLQLKPTATGVWLVWPIAALIGSLGVLLGGSNRGVEQASDG